MEEWPETMISLGIVVEVKDSMHEGGPGVWLIDKNVGGAEDKDDRGREVATIKWGFVGGMKANKEAVYVERLVGLTRGWRENNCWDRDIFSTNLTCQDI